MDQDWLEQIQIRIDQALDNALGTHLGDSKLLDAARYSVLRGGKRLRPAGTPPPMRLKGVLTHAARCQQQLQLNYCTRIR